MTKKKINIDFDKLSFYLKLKHMTTGDLANLLNVKRQTIYYWKINGTSKDNIMLMAHYLDIDVNELLSIDCG